MAKLPTVSSIELIKYLASRGFLHARTSGSHYMLHSTHSSRGIAVPRRKELGKGVLLSILADAGISRDEFVREFP